MNIELKENFNIKNLTTFKIGGVVSRVFFPKNIDEFIYLLQSEKEYIVLGSCSNLLFSSIGYEGTIISTSKLNNYTFEKNVLTADAGVKGPLLSQKALLNKLSGFEFMVGFPGSIGGNIYMNAGAHKQTISDYLVSALVYDKNDKITKTLSAKDLMFGYRRSILQDDRYILLNATFELKPDNIVAIKARMDNNVAFRQNTQPNLKYPNAGSVFKNTNEYSAGQLLDNANVKTIKINNVQVWDKHANFIINKGDATSENVLELMLKMYEKVYNLYEIRLVPEIKYIGTMTKREEEICRILYQKTQK